MQPCQILGLNHSVNLLEEGVVEIVVSCIAYVSTPKPKPILLPRSQRSRPQQPSSSGKMGGREREKKRRSSSLGERDKDRDNGSAATRDSESTLHTQGDPSELTRDRDMASRASSLGSVDEALPQQYKATMEKIDERGEASARRGLAAVVASTASASGDGSPSITDRQEKSSSKRGASTKAARVPSPVGGPAPLSIFTADPASSASLSALAALGLVRPPQQQLRGSQRAGLDDGHVLLTPLSEVPGARVKRYLGPVHLHFVKDSWAERGEGSLEPFFFLLISQAQAVARAQVASLGGNALLCYRMVSQESGGKVSRNQNYTILSISGDCVFLDE